LEEMKLALEHKKQYGLDYEEEHSNHDVREQI